MPNFINIFIDYDKAGAEWVVVAQETQDAGMLKAISGITSPHVHTAHLIYNLPYSAIEAEDKAAGKATSTEELTQFRNTISELSEANAVLPLSMTMRQAGKKANHALNYGEGINTFADQSDISIPEAKRLRNLYHAAYPGLQDWWQKLEFEVKKTRTLTNCFGRVIRFQGPIFGGGSDKTFREAYSCIPQSTVVDLTNQAMREVYNTLPSVALRSQNHDSLLYQHSIDLAASTESSAAILMSEMLHIKQALDVELQSPVGPYQIGTDAKWGLNWGDYNKTSNVNGMREIGFEIDAVYQMIEGLKV